MVTLLRLFIILFVVGIPSCAAGGVVFKLGYEHFNLWTGIIASVIAMWYASSRFDKKDKAAFDKLIAETGLKPDYMYYGISAIIIIDLSNKKIFMGGLSDRDILLFSDVTSIETDWVSGPKDSVFYRLILNTKNFNEPRKIFSFGDRKKDLDFVYSKFRVALGIA